MNSYIVDTNVFYTLGHYYPSRFPTIWEHIASLVNGGRFWSVKEVRNEIERNCPFDHIADWTQQNRKIFRKPASEELKTVAEIFRRKQFQGLVKRRNILKGLPSADPFIIAAGKAFNCTVLTQEKYKKNGAKIPNVCEYFEVPFTDLEGFLLAEELEF